MADRKQLIFCTYSSVYSSIVLKALLDDEEIEVVAIINSTRVLSPNYGHIRGAFEQIKMTGLRYAFYLFLITDGFSWSQPVLKNSRSSLKTMETIARRGNIPFHNTVDINHKSTIEFISKCAPDYLLAAHFNQLIKRDVLDLPRISCLNIHPSLLPAYKGVDPVFYAISDNNDIAGVSLHNMSEKFDMGDICLQKSCRLHSNESVFEKNCQLFLEGATLAVTWMKNPTKLMQQPKSVDSYDSWPTRQKVKAFHKSGKSLITLLSFWRRVSKYEA